MLIFRDGKFHAPGVTFLPPNGSYLETDPATPHESGITVWIESGDIWLDIYVDEDSDPIGSLQGLFAEKGLGLFPDSPIKELEVNGLKGYEVLYHDKESDYYECRLIVSQDTAIILYCHCVLDSIENLRELPEIQEVLSNIRKE